MQTTSLSMRRALSAALFVLLLSVAGTKNALAQNQVATLQHNGTITGTYYGENALTSAISAASDGDIITLSSGVFSFTNYINKRVTIHGAGCAYDSVTNVTKTQITGSFTLHNSCNASFEGIHFSGTIYCSGSGGSYSSSYGNSFVKCAIYSIKNVNDNDNDNTYNCSFVNCIIKNLYSYSSFSSCSSCQHYMLGLSLINSVARFVSYDHNNIYYPTTIYNSIVLFDNGLKIKNIESYNSIIAIDSVSSVSNCSFFNTLAIQTGVSSLFGGQTIQNVMTVDGFDDVFETFDGTISTYNNIYQLKNDIATGFLGNDGTEVGIYGGIMPYRTRPNYMIIRNCNVSNRTTEDNKLNVEIELLNAGE